MSGSDFARSTPRRPKSISTGWPLRRQREASAFGGGIVDAGDENRGRLPPLTGGGGRTKPRSSFKTMTTNRPIKIHETMRVKFESDGSTGSFVVRSCGCPTLFAFVNQPQAGQRQHFIAFPMVRAVFGDKRCQAARRDDFERKSTSARIRSTMPSTKPT